MKLDEMVSIYIRCRDRKSEMKAVYDSEVAKVDAVLDKIEQKLMAHMNETGAESIRTDAGTAYRTVRTSFTVADRDAFLHEVFDNGARELLETRCAKKAAEEYVQEYGAPPPGVNMTQVAQVNVRR